MAWVNRIYGRFNEKDNGSNLTKSTWIRTQFKTDTTKNFHLQLSNGTRIPIRVDPGQISFYLNKKLSDQIQQAQAVGHFLNSPYSLLSSIRYYACFDKDWRYLFQAGLTFCSYYDELEDFRQAPSTNWVRHKIKIRSFISLDGDIIQQIRKDFLGNRNCATTVSAHYWLGKQLLSHLKTNLNILAWQLALIIPVMSTAIKHIKPNYVVIGFGCIAKSITVFFVCLFVWLGLAIIYRWLVNHVDLKYLSAGLPLALACLSSISSTKFQLTVIILTIFFRCIIPKAIQWVMPRLLSSGLLWRSVGKQLIKWLVF